MATRHRRRTAPTRTRTRTPPTDPQDHLPDVRDGLTRPQRIVLTTLSELQREWGERPVPTAVLYGQLVEKLPISPDELQEILAGLTGGD